MAAHRIAHEHPPRVVPAGRRRGRGRERAGRALPGRAAARRGRPGDGRLAGPRRRVHDALRGRLRALRGAIAGVFTDDPEVLRVARRLFLVAAVFQTLDAANMILRGALRGAKDVRWVAVVGTSVAWIAIPGAAFVLGRLAGWGAFGGWIGFVMETTVGAAPVAVVARALAGGIWGGRGRGRGGERAGEGGGGQEGGAGRAGLGGSARMSGTWEQEGAGRAGGRRLRISRRRSSWRLEPVRSIHQRHGVRRVHVERGDQALRPRPSRRGGPLLERARRRPQRLAARHAGRDRPPGARHPHREGPVGADRDADPRRAPQALPLSVQPSSRGSASTSTPPRA